MRVWRIKELAYENLREKPHVSEMTLAHTLEGSFAPPDHVVEKLSHRLVLGFELLIELRDQVANEVDVIEQ